MYPEKELSENWLNVRQHFIVNNSDKQDYQPIYAEKSFDRIQEKYQAWEKEWGDMSKFLEE